MTSAALDRSGWIIFATTMFFIVGALDIIHGLQMVLNSEWIVFGTFNVWYLDVSAWGWITLIMGGVALLVSWAIYSGQTWGRIVGIIAATFAAIDAFLIMQYATAAALTILALSVLVIWALAVHGDEVS
jgi:hypothetical protein